ncbi:unnamed protein product [Absidia cylindrospora]
MTSNYITGIIDDPPTNNDSQIQFTDKGVKSLPDSLVIKIRSAFNRNDDICFAPFNLDHAVISSALKRYTTRSKMSAGQIANYHGILQKSSEEYYSTLYLHESKRQAGTRIVDNAVIRDISGKHFYAKILFYCIALIDGTERMLAALLPMDEVHYPVMNDNDENSECRIFPKWDCASGIQPRLIFVDVNQIVNVFGLLYDCKVKNMFHIIAPNDKIWRLSYLSQNNILSL